MRAYTGQQALERARATLPDLIILDAQMPDMHGFEVCRSLRADPRFGATTPIVITTSGPSGRTQRLEAYRAGAWEFLGQPLDGESLLLKLGTFLQCKRAVDSLREENLLDTGNRALQHAGPRASGEGNRVGGVAPPRSARVRGLRPRVGGGGRVEEPADEEAQRVSDQVGLLFQRAGRSSDAIGRLGQSEFAVIAPATGPEAALRLVRRLGGAVEGSPDAQFAGGERSIRIRAGYCAVPDFAQSPVDAIELLLRATTALRDLTRDGNGERIQGIRAGARDISELIPNPTKCRARPHAIR